MLIRCFQREFRLCFYHRLSIFNVLLFLLVIVSLFPLATSPDPKTLRFIGPGVIWICAFLAMLLSMQPFFKDDDEDGSLDHLLMMPAPLSYKPAHHFNFNDGFIVRNPKLDVDCGDSRRFNGAATSK